MGQGRAGQGRDLNPCLSRRKRQISGSYQSARSSGISCRRESNWAVAPTNFACHARALGAQTSLVTRVGNDAPGREILDRLPHFGLAIDTITVDDDAPTGSVSVELGTDGQPKFTIHDNVAWDHIVINAAAAAAAAQAGVICFWQSRAAEYVFPTDHPRSRPIDATRSLSNFRREYPAAIHRPRRYRGLARAGKTC